MTNGKRVFSWLAKKGNIGPREKVHPISLKVSASAIYVLSE